jgi:CDP-glucose 4,6-dehydratase
MFNNFFFNRRVLVTGHTGFKGSWLCRWLIRLRANLKGYSLAPPTTPSLYQQLGLFANLDETIADICNRDQLCRTLDDFKPEIIFHLAAQPLVRFSYEKPIETYQTNVMGSIFLLEEIRLLNRPCIVVMITTDKCYDNQEWLFGYREIDAMGGADPYSSSKGMAELAISAYRKSYFSENHIRLASARAGNVIGGGDWAADRIVPDFIRSVQRKEPVLVRNPAATRPWQHVLDPLYGYLLLAQELAEAPAESNRLLQLCSGFNFGPDPSSNKSVQELVEIATKTIPGEWYTQPKKTDFHEANLLHLCTDKARHLLKWTPCLNFEESAKLTFDWYKRQAENEDPIQLVDSQISYFEAKLKTKQN